MTDCCTFGCDQAPNCPARKATPGTHYCDKSRQICATPYTCSTACRLITDNSDGSSRDKPTPTPRASVLRWFAVLAVFTAAAAMTARLAGQF